MPKKRKKQETKELGEEEVIIGYNSNKKKTSPPKKKKDKKKEKKRREKEKKRKQKEAEKEKKEAIKLQKKRKKELKKNKKKREDEEEIIENKPKKKPKKKKQKKKKKRRISIKKILLFLLKIVLTLAAVAGIILFLFVSPVFNIAEITVSGAEEISESAYLAMAGLETGENIFSVNKTNIIAEIKKEPYVQSVEVKTIYPRKIEINVVERKISYITEQNGEYFYLDKHGYLLEKKLAPVEALVIKGCKTTLQELEIGGRINEDDLVKFNDLIKITDAVKNNEVEAELTSVDISDDNNYILEFEEEKKSIMLGDSSDLSAKMAWIDFFIRDKKNESGVVYLNVQDIYFSPN